MATVVTPRIRLDDEGVAWIEGSTAKVIELVQLQRAEGYSPEELQAELPHLSQEQVRAALAYYAAHQEELDADIERRLRWVEEMRAQEKNPLTRAELLARLSRTSYEAGSAIGR